MPLCVWTPPYLIGWKTVVKHAATSKTSRNFVRVATIVVAAAFVMGALVRWREDIVGLLESSNPLFIAGLILMIPYLILFTLLIRRAVRARLYDDQVLRGQVRVLQVLRWIGMGLVIAIGIGMALPMFAGEWDPYWIDAVQRGSSEYLPRAVAMAVHAVMVSDMVAGAAAFLSLWILGVVEIALCALAMGTSVPSWDVHSEQPVPDDIIVKVMGARIHGALSQIRPAWMADSSSSDRLQAVTELAQSVGTFHLTCGLILFAAWIVWSLLEIVIEVVTW